MIERPTSVMIQRRILLGRKEICQFLGISPGRFYRLLEAGLPVKKRAGQWSVHMEDIENFFRVGNDEA